MKKTIEGIEYEAITVSELENLAEAGNLPRWALDGVERDDLFFLNYPKRVELKLPGGEKVSLSPEDYILCNEYGTLSFLRA